MVSMLQIKNMSLNELDFAINAAGSEGWNPGLNDGRSFYKIDPNGFFMATLDGEPIGCISALAYNYHYGFIGFFMVSPEYRGKWVGFQLAKSALAYLGDRNIGLDGGIDKCEFYQNFGFKFAHKNIRFEGKASINSVATAIPISELNFAKLVEYDRQIFLFPRTEFLHQWIYQRDAFGYFLEDESHLVGYGIIRKSIEGYRIGPLFADNEFFANILLESLISNIPGESYYLDIPELNAGALELSHKFNMQKVFETVRMYSKEIPSVPLHKVFGITSFELG